MNNHTICYYFWALIRQYIFKILLFSKNIAIKKFFLWPQHEYHVQEETTTMVYGRPLLFIIENDKIIFTTFVFIYFCNMSTQYYCCWWSFQCSFYYLQYSIKCYLISPPLIRYFKYLHQSSFWKNKFISKNKNYIPAKN